MDKKKNGKKSEKNNNYKNKHFYSIKFIVIGDQSVGKTNIIRRFAKNEFSNEYFITIGMDFLSYNIEINNRVFNIQLWDTAGSERFRSVTKGYFSNSACAIIVYDITNTKSFNSIKDWVEECKLYTNNNIHLVLVGNKNDLKEQREISKEEGEEFAAQNGMYFFEASALTGENIENIFVESCTKINENIDNNVYNLEDPSNGIKKCKMEEDMVIGKKYGFQLETENTLENEKMVKSQCC